MSLMLVNNETAEIVATATEEGIEYRLLKAESGKGLIWIFDVEAGRTYSIIKYPTFFAAEITFKELI